MDHDIADLLGLELDDPETVALAAATSRDMDLVARLVQVRRDSGLTQREVAERMNRSQPNVSAFERVGGDPHLSTLRRYAGAVGAEIHWRIAVTGGASAIRFAPRSVDGRDDTYYRVAR